MDAKLDLDGADAVLRMLMEQYGFVLINGHSEFIIIDDGLETKPQDDN